MTDNKIINDFYEKIQSLARQGITVRISNNINNPGLFNVEVSSLGMHTVTYGLPGKIEYINEIIDDRVEDLRKKLEEQMKED